MKSGEKFKKKMRKGENEKKKTTNYIQYITFPVFQPLHIHFNLKKRRQKIEKN